MAGKVVCLNIAQFYMSLNFNKNYLFLNLN